MELTCNVLVVGGGCGGVAAALAATDLGRAVILTEVGSWIGGQLTSQAVPPDEHPWVESTRTTARYRRLRDSVRARYKQTRRLTVTVPAYQARHLATATRYLSLEQAGFVDARIAPSLGAVSLGRPQTLVDRAIIEADPAGAEQRAAAAAKERFVQLGRSCPDDCGPPGQTRIGNLGRQIHYHHRIKTHSGLQVCQPEPDAWRWRSPHHRIYPRQPHRHPSARQHRIRPDNLAPPQILPRPS